MGSTHSTERLHIDLAKNAYRATNHRDELPQMVAWLERQEKIRRHEKYICSKMTDEHPPPIIYDIAPGVAFERTMKMTLHPSVKSVNFDKLASDYGAVHFSAALARYVTRIRNPQLSHRATVAHAAQLHIPLSRIPVWHRVKWTTPDMYSSKAMGTIIVDSAHVNPERKDRRGHTIPGRFDTVLVNEGDGKALGLSGYRVAQIRVLFSLPQRLKDQLFAADEQQYVAKYLAYVEWFTPFASRPDGVHGLYKTTRSVDQWGDREASIVPVADFRRSVHLYPKFGPTVPSNWASSRVLDQAKYFYVNVFSDRHAYYTMT